MLLKFIGKDKSLGLKPGEVYDVEINAKYNQVWVRITWDTRMLSCPYESIKDMLNNWEELRDAPEIHR